MGSALALPALANNNPKTQTEGTTVSMPAASSQSTMPVSTPGRGLSKQQVIYLFGEPSARHQPMGDPPITRWDYKNFSVFFEYETVLHSVVPSEPTRVYHRAQLISNG